MPGWADDSHGEAFGAFLRSCDKLESLPGDRSIGAGARFGTVGSWREACAEARTGAGAAATTDNAAARAVFESTFRAFEVTPAARDAGKFTGYYEAELRGARTRGGRYVIPLYGVPDDLVIAQAGELPGAANQTASAARVRDGAFIPYADRAEIEAGYLDGHGHEIFWVDDPVDAFILHIQGSGRVRLPDGAMVRIGYAGNNGHAFVPVGRLMLDRGLISRRDANMPAIREWLRSHPHQAATLMAENPRYIFFREIDGDGPIGAQGVPLTAGRSLAVDRAVLPLGAPLWLDTTWPGRADRPLRRLVIAQDTGAAIKGAVRGDLYWGTGEEAFQQAGRMNQQGRYFILLPRAVAESMAASS